MEDLLTTVTGGPYGKDGRRLVFTRQQREEEEVTFAGHGGEH